MATDAIRRDLRDAFRGLRRARALTVLSIAILALGIGATTTMFSVVDAALLRPLPFDEPERLAMLYTTRTTARDGEQRTRWSWPMFQTLWSSVKSFDTIATYSPTIGIAIAGTGDPEQVDGEVVSSSYLSVLRIAPATGRFFDDADDVAGAVPRVIISDGLWRRMFADRRTVEGVALRVNGLTLPVIGVLPAGFAGLSGKASIWITPPMAAQLTYADYLTTGQRFIPVIGRLKSGASVESANAEVAAVAAGFDRPAGDVAATFGAAVVPLAEVRVDPVLRRSAFLLLAAAACVLLIACVNVASLLLARARTRRREMAVRIALGSNGFQIARLLMIEGLLLASAAAVFGVVIAAWGVRLFSPSRAALAAVGSRNFPMMSRFADPALDQRALGFIIVLAFATTILCALAAAIDGSRLSMAGTLKEDDRGGRRTRGLPSLVVAEVTLAVLLLTGAGLLIDSFARVQALRIGFEPANVVTFSVRPPTSRYVYPDDGPAIISQLLERMQTVPGVESVAANRCTPFTGCSRTVLFFTDRPNAAQAPVVGRHYISEDYFKTLGIPVLAGRTIAAADRTGSPPVAVINASGAQQFWPGESAIGRRVWFGGTTGPFADQAHAVEIVGVVGDVKYESIDRPETITSAQFYTSYRQFSYPDSMYVVKARASVASIVPALRQAVASVDSSLPIYDVQMLDDRVDGEVARPRVNATLLSLFGGVALLLAALGVYGVLSYSVSSRMREIGIRLALGADGPAVQRFFVSQGLKLAAIGAGLGVAAAVASGRLLQSVVVGDVRISVPILAGAVITMFVAAALAAYWPARRASKVEPWVVLRE